MIGYECRKILRQSHFFFFLLCLIILNLGMLLSKNRIYQNVIEDNEAYFEGRGLLAERISGTIDQDKLDFLMTEYENIVSGSPLLIGRDTYTGYPQADRMMFEQISEDVSNFLTYKDQAEAVAVKARENAAYYHRYGNRFLETESRQMEKSFSGRNITQYYDMTYMEDYFEYDFSTVLLLAAVLFMGTGIFQCEKEKRTEALIRMQSESKRIPVVKWASGQIILILTAVLLYGMDFLFYRCGWNLKGWNMPLYSLESYTYTSMELTILGFAGFTALCKIIALCSLLSLIYLISCVFPSYMTAYVFGFLVLAASISGYDPAARINPGTLLQGRKLLQGWETASLLGYPVRSVWTVILVCFLIQAGCVAGAWWIWTRRQSYGA